MYEDLFIAGEIHKKVSKLAFGELKQGLSFVNFSEFVEKKILDLGGGFGFPVCISVNGVAAHDVARFNDDRIFNKDDLVKIDFGVHVNKWMTDAAFSKYLGTDVKIKNLVTASSKALSACEEVLKPGVEIGVLGKAMGEVITGMDFNPIKNLTGHGVDKGRVHTNPNIPCYDTGSKEKIPVNKIMAIEPYATLGRGLAVDDPRSEIFRLANDKKNIRSFGARKMLDWIKKERGFMPFCTRWIPNYSKGGEFYLNTLIQQGIVKAYPILNEIDKGLTSQAEHTYVFYEKEVVKVT